MKLEKFYTLIFILIFPLINSYGQYDYLEDCANEQYKKLHLEENENFSVFDTIKEFENYLIDSGLLKDVTKKSYDTLIKKELSAKEIDHIKIYVKNNLKSFFEINDDGASFITLYNNCPSTIVRMSKEMSDEFYPIKKIYDKVIAEMYPEVCILKELSDKTDFNNEVSRLMLCNLIYRNWRDKI